MTVTNVTA